MCVRALGELHKWRNADVVRLSLNERGAETLEEETKEQEESDQTKAEVQNKEGTGRSLCSTRNQRAQEPACVCVCVCDSTDVQVNNSLPPAWMQR